MKKAVLLLLTCLLNAAVCQADTLVAKDKKQRISLPRVENSMTITYTPTAVAGGGKWQFMVVTPDGKIIKDKKNGKIDMQHPPAGPLSFKIRQPLLQGPYALVFYVVKRTDTTPVNLIALATSVSMRLSDRKTQLSIPDQFAYGNQASTTVNDTAQVVVDVMKP